MNRESSDLKSSETKSRDTRALLEIVTLLEDVIEELRDGGQDFSAQLIAMARLELMMKVHKISEHEMGALRSLVEDERQLVS